MDDASFRCFIECRADLLKGFRSLVLLAGAEKLQVTSLQGVELRFDAPIVQSFSSAAAHAPFS
jgi:hypothetical protein